MAYLWRLFQTGTLNSPPKSGNISALGQPEFWILSADQRPNWEAQSRARIGHRLHYNSKPSHLVLTVPTGRVHIQFTYLGTYSGGPTPHHRLAAPLCGSPLNTHSQIWTWTEGVVSSEGHSSKTLPLKPFIHTVWINCSRFIQTVWDRGPLAVRFKLQASMRIRRTFPGQARLQQPIVPSIRLPAIQLARWRSPGLHRIVFAYFVFCVSSWKRFVNLSSHF